MDQIRRFAAAVALLRVRWPEAVVGVRSPSETDHGGEVRLLPGFQDAAEYLHAELGDAVALRVGFFPYPMTGAERRLDWADSLPRLDDRVELVAEQLLVVPAGRSTRVEVRVLNRAFAPVVAVSSGALRGLIVDRSGRPVASSSGPHRTRRVDVRLDPGVQTSLPVVVGTASLSPEAGYCLLAGQWGLEVVLELQEAGRGRVGPVPLLVVAPTGLEGIAGD